ncbi:MAG: SprT-like domain-containing protein [Bdellovibrionales bacterium]
MSDKGFDWERAVIMELNREHGAIARARKVSLRPIAITLFDSETKWGQFDELTRTISISRKLVNEHPWDHVLGVLLHEMAHQYVAEQEGTARAHPQHHERPHGEAFQTACTRLGVPAQFAKAGLDLQSCDLDWRSEARDDASEKILDKVRKLLALANSTNENEALLAMEKVRELYARYNLEAMHQSSQRNFVHLVITHGKKRMESWEQRTISILTEHFFVEVLTFRQFEPRTGSRVHAVEIVGTRENVLMAEYVYHFLLNQTEFLMRKAVQGGTRLVRSEKGSFRLGVLDGFAKKLQATHTRPLTPRPSSPSASTSASATTASNSLTVIGEALTMFRDHSGIQEYLKEIYPRLGRRRGSTVTVNRTAFAAGHAAGQTLTLNKPLSTHMGNQGHRLSSRS